MPIYFKKKWWSGTDRDVDPGDVLDPQPEWPKPTYRPGQTIQYRTPKTKTPGTTGGYVNHVGVVRFVLRDKEGGTDYYRVIRTKNDVPEVTFDFCVIKRIEDE